MANKPIKYGLERKTRDALDSHYILGSSYEYPWTTGALSQYVVYEGFQVYAPQHDTVYVYTNATVSTENIEAVSDGVGTNWLALGSFDASSDYNFSGDNNFNWNGSSLSGSTKIMTAEADDFVIDGDGTNVAWMKTVSGHSSAPFVLRNFYESGGTEFDRGELRLARTSNGHTNWQLHIFDGTGSESQEYFRIDTDGLKLEGGSNALTDSRIGFLATTGLGQGDFTKLAAIDSTAAEINLLNNSNLEAADFTRLAATAGTIVTSTGLGINGTPTDGQVIQWDNANSRLNWVTSSGGGLDKYATNTAYSTDDVIWNESDDKIYVVDTDITAAANTAFSDLTTTELSAGGSSTAGAGIDITSDKVSVDLTSNGGLGFSGAGDARELQVDKTQSFVWSGLHTFGADAIVQDGVNNARLYLQGDSLSDDDIVGRVTYRGSANDGFDVLSTGSTTFNTTQVFTDSRFNILVTVVGNPTINNSWDSLNLISGGADWSTARQILTLGDATTNMYGGSVPSVGDTWYLYIENGVEGANANYMYLEVEVTHAEGGTDYTAATINASYTKSVGTRPLTSVTYDVEGSETEGGQSAVHLSDGTGEYVYGEIEVTSDDVSANNRNGAVVVKVADADNSKVANRTVATFDPSGLTSHRNIIIDDQHHITVGGFTDAQEPDESSNNEGRILYNTTSDTFKFGQGSNWREFITLDSTQTISGAKTWSALQTFNSTLNTTNVVNFDVGGADDWRIRNHNGSSTYIEFHGVNTLFEINSGVSEFEVNTAIDINLGSSDTFDISHSGNSVFATDSSGNIDIHGDIAAFNAQFTMNSNTHEFKVIGQLNEEYLKVTDDGVSASIVRYNGSSNYTSDTEPGLLIVDSSDNTLILRNSADNDWLPIGHLIADSSFPIVSEPHRKYLQFNSVFTVTDSSSTDATIIGLNLTAGDIPALATTKITSGVFNRARLSSDTPTDGQVLAWDNANSVMVWNDAGSSDLPDAPSGIDNDTSVNYNLRLTDTSGTEALSWEVAQTVSANPPADSENSSLSRITIGNINYDITGTAFNGTLGGGASAPVFRADRAPSSDAADTIIGRYVYRNTTDGNASDPNTDFVRLNGFTGNGGTDSITDGSEDGRLEIEVMAGGSYWSAINIQGSEGTDGPKQIVLGAEASDELDIKADIISNPTIKNITPSIITEDTSDASIDQDIAQFIFRGNDADNDDDTLEYGRILASTPSISDGSRRGAITLRVHGDGNNDFNGVVVNGNGDIVTLDGTVDVLEHLQTNEVRSDQTFTVSGDDNSNVSDHDIVIFEHGDLLTIEESGADGHIEHSFGDTFSHVHRVTKIRVDEDFNTAVAAGTLEWEQHYDVASDGTISDQKFILGTDSSSSGFFHSDDFHGAILRNARNDAGFAISTHSFDDDEIRAFITDHQVVLNGANEGLGFLGASLHASTSDDFTISSFAGSAKTTNENTYGTFAEFRTRKETVGDGDGSAQIRVKNGADGLQTRVDAQADSLDLTADSITIEGETVQIDSSDGVTEANFEHGNNWQRTFSEIIIGGVATGESGTTSGTTDTTERNYDEYLYLDGTKYYRVYADEADDDDSANNPWFFDTIDSDDYYYSEQIWSSTNNDTRVIIANRL